MIDLATHANESGGIKHSERSPPAAGGRRQHRAVRATQQLRLLLALLLPPLFAAAPLPLLCSTAGRCRLVPCSHYALSSRTSSRSLSISAAACPPCHTFPPFHLHPPGPLFPLSTPLSLSLLPLSRFSLSLLPLASLSPAFVLLPPCPFSPRVPSTRLSLHSLSLPLNPPTFFSPAPFSSRHALLTLSSHPPAFFLTPPFTHSLPPFPGLATRLHTPSRIPL